MLENSGRDAQRNASIWGVLRTLRLEKTERMSYLQQPRRRGFQQAPQIVIGLEMTD
jgi:hypothetical protein